MFGSLGPPELLIILVIILIVFGAGRLPNVMRDVGKGVKEFKRAQTEEGGDAPLTAASTSAPASPPPAPVATTNGAAAQSSTVAPAPPRNPETTSRA